MRSRPSNLRLDRRKRGLPLLPILLGLSLASNAWFFLKWEPKGGEGRLTDTVRALAEKDAEPVEQTAEVQPAEESPAEPVVASPAIEEPTPAEGGPRFVKVTIDGAVARAFTDLIGSKEGSPVAVTAGRLFSWWLDPSRDPRKGDVAAVYYEPNEITPNEILVHALSYRSQKMGKNFEAFLFKPEGWSHATWFDAEGKEVPARLDPPVLPEYEQITSLVGDGRGHSGMDFKVDVGTPVLTPFAGTVVRTDWNHRYNGNSVEVRSEGRRLRFLHLNETGVKAGQKLAAGAEIGKSGNTGRSFAPHLHYEIVDGNGRVINPLKVHKQGRRTVPVASQVAFEAEVERLRTVLTQDLSETITPAPVDGSK